MEPLLCQVCRRTIPPNRWKLCRACRSDAFTPNGHREPTEEELDALIAERMKDLPRWWDKEHPNR